MSVLFWKDSGLSEFWGLHNSVVEESVHPGYNAALRTDFVVMYRHIPDELNHQVRVIKIQTAMLFYTMNFF